MFVLKIQKKELTQLKKSLTQTVNFFAQLRVISKRNKSIHIGGYKEMRNKLQAFTATVVALS